MEVIKHLTYFYGGIYYENFNESRNDRMGIS